MEKFIQNVSKAQSGFGILILVNVLMSVLSCCDIIGFGPALYLLQMPLDDLQVRSSEFPPKHTRMHVAPAAESHGKAHCAVSPKLPTEHFLILCSSDDLLQPDGQSRKRGRMQDV